MVVDERLMVSREYYGVCPEGYWDKIILIGIFSALPRIYDSRNLLCGRDRITIIKMVSYVVVLPNDIRLSLFEEEAAVVLGW
jgi:hypothetical protein